ncbi:cupin domain-containing protein [Azospirillum soli]|uniref:cupin domain-containing protein n=1 Tax=Azospirillum soli TaxID=1304799 RepID=UPI001AE71A59|nr:cupin domain-containing protein [Azospirillum soli]MBP2313750.1 quercetin dioxygenase-like cupin family protein [Azospirillum soli]
MKFAMIATSILVLAGTAPAAVAQTATPSDTHKMVTPTELTWSAAPPVLPKGVQLAVLYGDPAKAGPFVMRLKIPANQHLPAHTHPVDELVTVISGTFKLGMGGQMDKNKTQPLPAGSFFALAPGAPHFAYIDEETVVQIATNGPWGLTYVNPSDDPRQKTQ